jgi:hypothetical protein
VIGGDQSVVGRPRPVGTTYIRDARRRLALETFSSSVSGLTCIDTISPGKV